MLKYPLLVINLKTYAESDIKHAKKIAKAVKDINSDSIILCPENTELGCLKQEKANLFAQHIDSVEPGAHTGYTLAESVKENGAIGTILNHSEHKLPIKELQKCIKRAKENNLLTLVCASTPAEAKKIAKFSPAMIAIEPPELIGGDISVSTAKPEIITKTIKAVEKVNNIPVLCGAGIKNRDDVQKSIELGAKGVLVASGIVKSKSPKRAIKNLI